MVGGAAQRKARVSMPRLWLSDPIDGRTVLVRRYIRGRGFTDHHPVLDMKGQRRRGGVDEWREVGINVLRAGVFPIHRPEPNLAENRLSFRRRVVDMLSPTLQQK